MSNIEIKIQNGTINYQKGVDLEDFKKLEENVFKQALQIKLVE